MENNQKKASPAKKLAITGAVSALALALAVVGYFALKPEPPIPEDDLSHIQPPPSVSQTMPTLKPSTSPSPSPSPSDPEPSEDIPSNPPEETPSPSEDGLFVSIDEPEPSPSPSLLPSPSPSPSPSIKPSPSPSPSVKPSPSPSPIAKKAVLYVYAGEGCPDEIIDPEFLGAITVTGKEYDSAGKWINAERTFTYEEKEIINNILRLRYSVDILCKETEYHPSTLLPKGYVWSVLDDYAGYLQFTKDTGAGDWIVFNTDFTGEMSQVSIHILKIPD